MNSSAPSNLGANDTDLENWANDVYDIGIFYPDFEVSVADVFSAYVRTKYVKHWTTTRTSTIEFVPLSHPSFAGR